MNSVSDKIIQKIQKDGPGSIFTPKDFIDLGTRQAVDTALSRLASAGKIRRLSRGLYDHPKKHRLLGQLLPSLDDIAKTIAKTTDSKIQISGARALHLLGLTKHVPAQTVYLTNGPTKKINIHGSLLHLKHVSNKTIVGAGTKAGSIIQALRYLGKNNLNNKILDKIISQLDNNDKEALSHIARFAPDWTKPFVNRIVAS